MENAVQTFRSHVSEIWLAREVLIFQNDLHLLQNPLHQL